ncbi:MAG: 2-hydroxyacyl-CoA dehydratase [Dehalococcoidia bacterium]|nr:2-hydroxyacyl-CoA dehydratase [Dehalococcoidia bacterium]
MVDSVIKYKTKPVDCWDKMKELRRWHFKQTWEAQRSGGLVAMGIFEWFLALCAGFGEFCNPSYGPYFTRMMRDNQKAKECFELSESKGFDRSICASMRCHLGQLYMGLTQKSPDGKSFKPDFICQPAACYAMDKTGQIVGEHIGVQHISIDFPTKDNAHTRQYLADELTEAIVQIEKLTGKHFDDAKFIEAVHNEWESMVLWARIAELNKNIPAPLNYKQMQSLRIPIITMRHTRECVEFFRLLLDEVKDRVQQGISASGYETRRLLHMFMAPFYSLDVLREPEKYGAVIIGGDGVFSTMAAWNIHPDGTWEAAKTPKERGIVFNTRQDALESFVDLYIAHLPPSRCGIFVNPAEINRMVHDWHADGVIFMLDKGCRTLSVGQEDQILSCKQSGIPTMAYDGSNADYRDLNNEVVQRQFEVFCQEILGLSKI